MNNSKKTKQLLEKLDKIEEILYYYMGNNNKYINEIRKDINEIRDKFEEMSLETKEHNVRLAKRIKEKIKKDKF